MDKYEFKIKAEQIQKLIEGKDYKMAAKIADGIDWRRVKNIELLTQVSEVYEKLKRYEDSYEILNMAYDRAPIGRMIVYKMAEIATYLKDFDEATELYKEFVRIAPHDLSRYVLKYKIYEAKEAPAEDLIAILEEFKSREYHEKWAYELALLYYKEGMKDKCVEECDDLILWFSEGEYVRRAMELKMQIQPLTATQEQKYRTLVGELEAQRRLAEAENQQDTDLNQEESWAEEQEEDQDIQVRTVDPEERYSTVNLQAEVAAGLRDFLNENEGDGYREEAYAGGEYSEESYGEEAYEGYGEEEYPEESYEEGYGEYVEEESPEESYEEEDYEGYAEEGYPEESYEEEDYEGYAEEGYPEESYEEEGYESYAEEGYPEESYEEEGYEGYAEEGYPEESYEEEGYEGYAEEEYPEESYEEEGYEGYAEEEYPEESYEEGYGEYVEEESPEESYEEEGYEGYSEEGSPEESYEEEQPEEPVGDVKSGEKSQKETTVGDKLPGRPRKLYLGQREDGQLTFDDRENVLDRQITGQMSISDIMAEWENKKQKMEEALERLAVQEQERKAAALRREQEEEEGESLIPPDVQQLLDEIEGKLPVKIIVEPIERDQPEFLQERGENPKEPIEAADETEEWEEADEDYTGEYTEEAGEGYPGGESYGDQYDGSGFYEEDYAGGEPYEESYDEPFDEDWEEPGVEESLESDSEFADALENDDDLPEEPEEDEIEAILRAALQEEIEENGDLFEKAGGTEEETEEEQPVSLPESEEDSKEEDDKGASWAAEEEKSPRKEGKETGKSGKRKTGPASSMMWDLEKVLEDELKHVSGGRLNEEQEKLFAYFTSVHGMNRQLSQFLEDEEKRELDGTSVTGNIVVTGESGNGKTTLAVDLVKAIQKLRGAKNSKMAKVTGESLNQRDVAAVVRRLTGGALVIEHAGGLTGETAAKLSGAMLGQTNNLFVVLEDDAAEIKRLFTRCESLAAKFNRTIEIPVFTNHELVAFGKSYGQEQGYVLDEMAVLALYNRIGNNQTSDHLVNVAEVKDMIDDAIISSSRRGIKKLFSKRRQDEFGNYVLMEKDFEL